MLLPAMAVPWAISGGIPDKPPTCHGQGRIYAVRRRWSEKAIPHVQRRRLPMDEASSRASSIAVPKGIVLKPTRI